MRRALLRIRHRLAVAHPVRGIEAKDRILLLRVRGLASGKRRDYTSCSQG